MKEEISSLGKRKTEVEKYLGENETKVESDLDNVKKQYSGLVNGSVPEFEKSFILLILKKSTKQVSLKSLEIS